jgi:hypothetical protein
VEDVFAANGCSFIAEIEGIAAHGTLLIAQTFEFLLVNDVEHNVQLVLELLWRCFHA